MHILSQRDCNIKFYFHVFWVKKFKAICPNPFVILCDALYFSKEDSRALPGLSQGSPRALPRFFCIFDFINFIRHPLFLLQILTQEDWNIVLFLGMQRTSHWAALYFVALMTFGNYVLFNLLVAILVEGFSNQVSDFLSLWFFEHTYHQNSAFTDRLHTHELYRIN